MMKLLGQNTETFSQGKGKAVGCGALHSSFHGICIKGRSVEQPSRSPGDEELWLLAGMLCCCAGALWSCSLLISASPSKASLARATSTSQPPFRMLFKEGHWAVILGRSLEQKLLSPAVCHQLVSPGSRWMGIQWFGLSCWERKQMKRNQCQETKPGIQQFCFVPIMMSASCMDLLGKYRC